MTWPAELMDILILLYWGMVLLLIIAIPTTSAIWVFTMPKPGSREVCLPFCWLPPITHDLWTSHEYSCRDCGRRWKVEVDMTAPREHYRYWVAR